MSRRDEQQDGGPVVLPPGNPEMGKLGIAFLLISVGTELLLYFGYKPWDDDIRILAVAIPLLLVPFGLLFTIGNVRMTTELDHERCVRHGLVGAGTSLAWEDVQQVRFERASAPRVRPVPTITILGTERGIRLMAAQGRFWEAALLVDEMVRTHGIAAVFQREHGLAETSAGWWRSAPQEIQLRLQRQSDELAITPAHADTLSPPAHS